MKKIINLNQYVDDIKNNELKLENIISYLQIKLLEELFYRADIEIEKLHEKFIKMPGICNFMALGGEENLDFYFYNLYIDKLFDQVIMADKDNTEVPSIIYDIRMNMLNSLIKKYLPSAAFLINDEKFNRRFFKECASSEFFTFDKSEINNFFKYRNEVIKFESIDEDEVTESTYNNLEECSEINDEILGKIEFVEEKNIYFCDFIGAYDNFTIKILSNKREEVVKTIPLIHKIIDNINYIKDINFKESEKKVKSDNKNDLSIQVSEENALDDKCLYENVYRVAESSENLLTIHIWPEGKVYFLYSNMVRNEENVGIEIAAFGYENINEEFEKLEKQK